MKYILILAFAVALEIAWTTSPAQSASHENAAEELLRVAESDHPNKAILISKIETSSTHPTEDAAKTLVDVTQANHLSEVDVGEIRTSAADPASDFVAKMANYINAPLTFCAGSANGARCWYLRPGNPPAMCADPHCNDVKAATASH